MVKSFSDADELLNVAMTWGLQDSPAVRLRLFQQRNPQYGDEFVIDELDALLHTLRGPPEQIINDVRCLWSLYENKTRWKNQLKRYSSTKKWKH